LEIRFAASGGGGYYRKLWKTESLMENNEFNNTEEFATEPISPVPGKRERQWAMGCHLAALAGYMMSFLAANLVGPLIIWLLKRDEGTFIDDQGKESVNFQISLLIYSLACVLMIFIGIGLFLLIPLGIFGFVCPIIGAVKASDGIPYRYPLCIRFIK
jgi:uncharacterized protein